MTNAGWLLRIPSITLAGGVLLRQGMLPVLLGLALGLAGALALTRVLRSLLFEVTPYDAATFAALTGLVLLLALAACYVPARRAARLDHMSGLRSE